MADELIDIFDEENNSLGIKKMKSDAHADGAWHRTTHVWMYNKQGDVLLQLRAKEKKLYPDMWDISAAGHITAGEDPLPAALREIEEEIGLIFTEDELDFWKVRPHKSVYKDIVNNEFFYIYFVQVDTDITQLSLQKEEVAGLKFFSVEEIKQGLISRPEAFTPHGVYWDEILAEIERRGK